MANVVWSLFLAPPPDGEGRTDELLAMAGLWAAHLRGPGEHAGDIMVLTDMPSLAIAGVRTVPVTCDARTRPEIFAARPELARRHIHPEPDDRYMQLDLDSLARHPIAPLFAAIEPGEMRVAPSMLPLLHPQQARFLVPRWRRWWYRRVRGWDRRLGVSASVTACHGADWTRFMGAWADVIRGSRGRALDGPRPGDQGHLNYLYAFGRIPMRRYGPDHIHHLRVDDRAPPDRIDRARVLHFPVPDKLERMREWSRV